MRSRSNAVVANSVAFWNASRSVVLITEDPDEPDAHRLVTQRKANYARLDTPNYAQAYWADAQAGLYAVKCKYDPTHAFRFAQEVPPLMPSGGGIGPVIVLPAWLQQALEQPIVRSMRPRC